MKIAVVRRECSLRRAGAERYCVNLLRQLLRQGHDVSVVAERLDPELRDEVEFLPVRVNHATSWTKNRSFAENAGKVLAGNRFDIAYGLSLAEGLDCFRVTDPLHAHWMNVFYRGRLQRRLQPLNPRHRTVLELESSILQSQGVRRVVTQSSLDTRLVSHYYNIPRDRIERIPNGVDTDCFQPGRRSSQIGQRAALGIDATTPLLVFASMDFRRKKLDSLLRAMARLQRRDTRLLVLGSGATAYYRLKAHALGIERRVHFCGRVQDIQNYYNAGDLFVLPTLYEPFPNVNLEAMACGLPVLTSKATGSADIIEHGINGYLVEHSDAIADMANIIDHHFSQPEERMAAMSQACVQTACSMSLHRNGQRMIALFEEILREKLRI